MDPPRNIRAGGDEVVVEEELLLLSQLDGNVSWRFTAQERRQAEQTPKCQQLPEQIAERDLAAFHGESSVPRFYSPRL
jgi:hypothetical protein